jgi:hypothetical protein
MPSAGEQELEAALSAATSTADRIAYAAGFIVGRARRAGIESVVVSGGAASFSPRQRTSPRWTST